MTLHSADIYPELDLISHPARREPAYARAENKRGTLGNGFLEVRLSLEGKRTESATIENKLIGESYQLAFSPVEAICESGTISAESFRVTQVESRGSSDMASLTIHGDCGWFKSSVSYVVARGEHVMRKTVVLHGFTREARVNEVSLFKHEVDASYDLRVHDAGMFSPVVFLRGADGGLFFCAEFLGYFSEVKNRSLRFYYYPAHDVVPGHSFRLMTACIGVYGLVGRPYSNPYHETGAELDEGEASWFREYLMQGAPPQGAPVVEVAGFPFGLEGPSDLETLDQCGWFSAERVYLPNLLRSPASYPHRASVSHRLGDEGISATLALGHDIPQSLHWLALSPHGLPATPDVGACFGFDEFRDYLIDRYQMLLELYRFRDIEVSGTPIVPCSNPGHDHGSGLESLQKAFWGLIEVVAALRESVGHVGCSGPYAAYGAGLARICDWMTGLADAHPLPLPDIHVGRLFADMNRLYFRRSHAFLLPLCKMGNTIGFSPASSPSAPYPGADHFPWYCYHDSAGWRYAVLSAVATGHRHRIFAVPADLGEEDRAFARHWFGWQARNLCSHRHVLEILDCPGLGNVDGYAYADARGATVFLFNCSYDEQDVQLRPHLHRDADYVFREVYPCDRLYLGPSNGLFRRDSVLGLRLKPREARVVEMVRRSPASAKRKRPEVFGCSYREDDEHVVLLGEAGSRCDVGVRMGDRYQVHDIRFPGTAFPRHLRDWTYTVRAYRDGAEQLPAGQFPGKVCTPEMLERRNVWLYTKLNVPREYASRIHCSPFELQRPCWAYPDCLFFVVRFEGPAMFDPIRTGTDEVGVPEGYKTQVPIKCGIDLAPLNLGLRAWINGEECTVHSALAAWRGFSPNANPVTAYFFEAGSKLRFGHQNHVVLFANRFDAGAFKGIMIEHLPELPAERILEVK
ncbi:MAG: hypothetical protein AMXMBFR84_18020 [Candidatus Hydrogenedentota bacterium]